MLRLFCHPAGDGSEVLKYFLIDSVGSSVLILLASCLSSPMAPNHMQEFGKCDLTIWSEEGCQGEPVDVVKRVNREKDVWEEWKCIEVVEGKSMHMMCHD